MKDVLLKQIKEKHEESNGKSGILTTDFKGDYFEVRKNLLQLHKEGKVIARDSVKGKLIFLKQWKNILKHI